MEKGLACFRYDPKHKVDNQMLIIFVDKMKVSPMSIAIIPKH